MPDLPDDNHNYERVLIHDNYCTLQRLLGSRGCTVAETALKEFNGRFIVIPWEHRGVEISLVSTGMGSAQTNCLVESIARWKKKERRDCKGIVKLGTCSSLQKDLKEGQTIVVNAAISDEGSTSWRRTKKKAGANHYASIEYAREYVQSKNLIFGDVELTAKLRKKLGQKSIHYKEGCVWSVDAYDCFNESKGLYKWIDSNLFKLPEFFTQRVEEVEILGVEMECSALFASGTDLRIPTTALIIVSWTLDYLLGLSTKRNENLIHCAEQKCFEAALNLLAKL